LFVYLWAVIVPVIAAVLLQERTILPPVARLSKQKQSTDYTDYTDTDLPHLPAQLALATCPPGAGRREQAVPPQYESPCVSIRV